MNTQLNNNYGNVPVGQGNSQWSNPPAGSMPFSDPPQPAVQAPPAGYPGNTAYGGYGGNVPPAGPPVTPPGGGDPDGSKRRRTIGWIIAVALLDLLLLLLFLLLPSRCTCDGHHGDNVSELVSDNESDDSYFDSIPDDPDREAPADSVANDVEEVIEGGGQLQFTVKWEHGDEVDIDAHCREADGHEIFYPNKRERSRCGGILDIDNQEHDSGRIEHITYADCATMMDGNYTFIVENYTGGNNHGIKAYLTANGKTYQYNINSLTRRSQQAKVAQVTVSNGRVTNINHFLNATEVDIQP